MVRVFIMDFLCIFGLVEVGVLKKSELFFDFKELQYPDLGIIA